jgi:hypothetical protein
MDPKGKGIVIDKKDEETVNNNEPNGENPIESWSNNKKKDRKKKRHIKKIVYYDNDASSFSPKEDDDDDSSSKKKMDNQNYYFDYSHIPYNSNDHLLSICLGQPLTWWGRLVFLVP